MDKSAVGVEFRDKSRELLKLERIGKVASNRGVQSCASECDRLPLGLCLLIWFVMSAAMWGGIVGLGLLVFS